MSNINILEIAEEIWDDYSELVGTDIDDLSMFAGSIVLTERNYKKLIQKLQEYILNTNG